MQITSYSFDDDGVTKFYCYLKSDAGNIAEAIGCSFIRAFLKAFIKLIDSNNEKGRS